MLGITWAWFWLENYRKLFYTHALMCFLSRKGPMVSASFGRGFCCHQAKGNLLHVWQKLWNCENQREDFEIACLNNFHFWTSTVKWCSLGCCMIEVGRVFCNGFWTSCRVGARTLGLGRLFWPPGKMKAVEICVATPDLSVIRPCKLVSTPQSSPCIHSF